MLLCGVTVSAQIAPNDANQEPSKTPAQRVLDENDFFRVIRLQLTAGQATTISGRGQDSIVVALLGKNLVARDVQGNASSQLPQGEVRFVSRGSPIVILNVGEDPAEIVAAFLKHHFDAEVRPCVEPHKCTRPIETGAKQIGESTLLFTSGFIVAYRHRLERGGTLVSSYYSSSGKDHLLLVAMSDLQANFDGEEERFTEGQVYTSDASQIEVNASSTEARWVVIRMEIPKHSD